MNIRTSIALATFIAPSLVGCTGGGESTPTTQPSIDVSEVNFETTEEAEARKKREARAKENLDAEIKRKAMAAVANNQILSLDFEHLPKKDRGQTGQGRVFGQLSSLEPLVDGHVVSWEAGEFIPEDNIGWANNCNIPSETLAIYAGTVDGWATQQDELVVIIGNGREPDCPEGSVVAIDSTWGAWLIPRPTLLDAAEFDSQQ